MQKQSKSTSYIPNNDSFYLITWNEVYNEISQEIHLYLFFIVS